MGWVGVGRTVLPWVGRGAQRSPGEIALSRLFNVKLGKECGQEKEQKEHSRQ